MARPQNPFNRGVEQVSVTCPKCGPLTVCVSIVHSVLLRRRAEIEAFILAGHTRAEHGYAESNGSNHN